MAHRIAYGVSHAGSCRSGLGGLGAAELMGVAAFLGLLSHLGAGIARMAAEGLNGHILRHLLRDLSQKAGGHIPVGGAVKHTLAGVDQIELFPGAGNAHIGQSALLLQLLLAVHSLAAGEDTLLHTGDKHHREFQALGGVQGHQHHRVLIVVIGVNVGHQRHILQKVGQLKVLVLLLIFNEHGGKFLDIVQPILVLLRVVLLEIVRVLGLFQNLLEQVAQEHTVLQATLEVCNLGGKIP